MARLKLQPLRFWVRLFLLSFVCVAMLWPEGALPQGLPMVNVTSGKAGQQYTLTLQLLALMTVLSVLPSLLLMMTSFVRVIIVLSILRQALGTGQTPPNTVLVGLALFLTFFIMTPVFDDVYKNALSPCHCVSTPFSFSFPFSQYVPDLLSPVSPFLIVHVEKIFYSESVHPA